jgi:hypothetical protein
MAKHSNGRSGAPGKTAGSEVPVVAHAQEASRTEEGTLGGKVLTVAAVGAAAALIEAELIPGIIVGAAAMLVPDLVPRLSKGLRPFLKGAIRAGYDIADKAKETFAEASEQWQDMVAEAKYEHDGAPHTERGSETSTGAAAAATEPV